MGYYAHKASMYNTHYLISACFQNYSSCFCTSENNLISFCLLINQILFLSEEEIRFKSSQGLYDLKLKGLTHLLSYWYLTFC